MPSDSDLVRLARGGEPAAYEELVRRWSARVMAVCHARIRSAHTAEEMAQESLLRAFRSLGTLEEPSKFGAWICGIASRLCLDWLKSRKSRQLSLEAVSEDQSGEWVACRDGTPDEVAARADDHHRLLEELDRLPGPYREVILLYYYDDVTYRDLSEILGVSAATINARLTKARAMLRERLSGMQR